MAWAEGIESNRVGFSGMLEDLRALLKVPDELDVVAVLPRAFPATQVGKGRKRRKPRSEIVHLESSGVLTPDAGAAN